MLGIEKRSFLIPFDSGNNGRPPCNARLMFAISFSSIPVLAFRIPFKFWAWRPSSSCVVVAAKYLHMTKKNGGNLLTGMRVLFRGGNLTAYFGGVLRIKSRDFLIQSFTRMPPCWERQKLINWSAVCPVNRDPFSWWMMAIGMHSINSMRSKFATIKSTKASQSARFNTSEKNEEIIDQHTTPGQANDAHEQNLFKPMQR